MSSFSYLDRKREDGEMKLRNLRVGRADEEAVGVEENIADLKIDKEIQSDWLL